MNDDTLIVGRFHSKCGACGKDCDPIEETHERVLGWGKEDEAGCGVRWTKITTEYIGPEIEEATQALRPDLEFVEHEVSY